ncbi:MAG TPA: hypothetical protein VNL35_01110 [Chloroflexota bacterium]|nr:hypothetical protein [Chloroflexota bacterium]
MSRRALPIEQLCRRVEEGVPVHATISLIPGSRCGAGTARAGSATAR